MAVRLNCVWLGLGLALSASLPVAAFDNIERFASSLPLSFDSPQLFDYAAPSGGFGMSGRGAFIPTDNYLARAIAEGASPDAMTGIDFSAVTGLLSFGQPPANVTVLFGDMGFAAGAVDALPGRDFQAQQVGSYPVYWRGEDYRTDIALSREGDPLNAGLGKSQRLALGGDFLVRTAGWSEMHAVIDNMEKPTHAGDLWNALFAAVEDTSPDDMTLELAAGWAATAFLEVPDLADLTELMEAPEKTKTPPAADEVLLFPAALFALTQGQAQAGLHIALPFATQAMAEQAAGIITERLIADAATPAEPTTRITVDDNGVHHAVITIALPVAEIGALHETYVAWTNAIYQRNFQPLMLGP